MRGGIKTVVVKLQRLRPLLELATLLFYFGGIISFFYYPNYVVNNTYMSEHALMPGSATVGLDRKGSVWADQMQEILRSELISDEVGAMRRILEQEAGAQTYIHHYEKSHGGRGEMVVGMLRAWSGYGTEAIVVTVTHEYGSRHRDYQGYSLATALLRELEHTKWLNKGAEEVGMEMYVDGGGKR